MVQCTIPEELHIIRQWYKNKGTRYLICYRVLEDLRSILEVCHWPVLCRETGMIVHLPRWFASSHTNGIWALFKSVISGDNKGGNGDYSWSNIVERIVCYFY